MDAKQIRKLWIPTKPKQPCYICGKYEKITEAHHLIPVKYLTRLFKNVRMEDLWRYIAKTQVNISVPFIWLCPTHHAVWHMITDNNGELRDDFVKRLLSLKLGEEETVAICRVFDELDIGALLVSLTINVTLIEDKLDKE